MKIQALSFALDIDGDGAISGWEFTHALKWGFTLPGRLITEGLGNIAPIANALGIQASAETGYASFHSLLATGLNLGFWVLLLILITRIGSGSGDKTTDNDPQDGEHKSRYRGPQARQDAQQPPP